MIDIDNFISSLLDLQSGNRCKYVTYHDIVKALAEQGLRRNWKGIIVPIKEFSPRFSVGDWITDGTRPLLISSIDTYNNLYYFHESSSTSVFSWVDREYHLWTIQDAKDGDVIKIGECFVLFKELKDGNALCYCWYKSYGRIEFPNLSYHLFGTDGARPSTQFEREEFFLKLQNEGYTWDDEEKTVLPLNTETTGEKPDKMKVVKYLETLDKDECLSIIKYGLRGSNAPEDVTVEDIFTVIGCLYNETA